MKKREQALKWWRSLNPEEQLKLSWKHFPTMAFILVCMSSSRIEQIFEKENN